MSTPAARTFASRPVQVSIVPSRSSIRDSTLYDRLRARDADAIAAIFAEYRPLLIAYLTTILGQRADAEDVAQGVLVEVWQRAPEFDPERGSLRTWLLLICRSRAIDHLRRRVPEPRDPSALPAIESGEGDPELDAMLERWRLADMLRRLPRQEALLLRLRFQEGLSQREIAERTSLPLGTVKTSMVRALRRLRDLLEQEER